MDKSEEEWFYRVCVALDEITAQECCEYGFHNEVVFAQAHRYLYEHKEKKND